MTKLDQPNKMIFEADTDRPINLKIDRARARTMFYRGVPSVKFVDSLQRRPTCIVTSLMLRVFYSQYT
jgi:hypothetical protein